MTGKTWSASWKITGGAPVAEPWARPARFGESMSSTGAPRRAASSGRPNLVWLDRAGRLHLADFKTNRLASPDGDLLAEHSFQLRLYALALRRLYAKLAFDARLEYLWPGIGLDVALDEAVLEEVENELLALLGFAAAHSTLAEYEARPAGHCRWCPYANGICEKPTAVGDAVT